MRAQSIKGYILIGYDLRYLFGVSTDHHVYGEKHVLDTISRFISACADNGLMVTSRAAGDLYGSFVRKYPNRQTASEHAITLTPKDVAVVREASSQIQTVMLAEAEDVFAHVTDDKRFAVEKLLNNIASLMTHGIYDALPDIAKYDFQQAGRCLAFELPTAAAFHLMRGTEDVLKLFYCSVITHNRVALMWGPMAADLRRRLDPPAVVLLNNLDNLRTGFRNPTQHPEKIYDIEEAQDLFALSVEAVNRMIKYLGARQASGPR